MAPRFLSRNLVFVSARTCIFHHEWMAPPHLPRQLPTLPLSKPVSDRRSRDAAAGYGGNDHIVRAHTAAGTEQRGAPPPAQCMFTRRTIEEARRGGASLSEQRGHGGAANQRRHG